VAGGGSHALNNKEKSAAKIHCNGENSFYSLFLQMLTV
jgi:hypothetical protein